MPASQPVQNRSKRTFEAILEATEKLLDQHSFESISIAEIILKSGSSTGSFYARFSGKDALLSALYARYHADLPERFAKLSAILQSNSLGLAEACRGVVDEFAAFFEGRHNLMRAITIHARTQPGQIRPLLGQRFDLHRQMVDLFRPFHADINRSDPEVAVRIGLFLAATAIREGVLFPEAPFAAATGQPINTLKREVSGMLFAYLTSKPEYEK